LLGRLAAVFERWTGRGREKYLTIGAAAALAFAYRDLLTLGTRYTLETGLENWLLAPNDRAPIVAIAISAWLLYRRWHRLAGIERRAGPLWLIAPCFALGLASYAWGVHTQANELQALSLILNAVGLTTLNWGLPGLRALWLPIAVLLFAIPIPTPLVVELLWKLRLWTADYTGWLLWALRLPALVSGDQILRVGQNFQVIEGCSGLRSAETLTMLVVLMIDLFHRRGWQAAILLVCSPLVAFGLNGLRVLTLILNPHAEIVAVHSLQGIAILLAGLLVIYALDAVIERFGSNAQEMPTKRPAGLAPDHRGAGAGVRAGVSLLAAATLLASIVTPRWLPTSVPIPPIEAAVDAALAPYEWEPLAPDHYFHGRIRFRRSVHRSYQFGRARVEVFVGVGSVRDRNTTPFGRLNELPGSGWTVRRAGQRELTEGGRQVRELLVEKEIDRRVVIQWYEGAHSLAGETLRFFLGLERSHFQRPPPFLVVRLSTGVQNFDEETLRIARKHWVEPVYSRLESALSDIAAARE